MGYPVSNPSSFHSPSWLSNPGSEAEGTPGVIWKSICHLATTLMGEPDHLMVEKDDGNVKMELQTLYGKHEPTMV